MMRETWITNPILPCQTQNQLGYQVASGEIYKPQSVSRTGKLHGSEEDYKKVSLVNDDVLKLWEETEADNRRLVGEMGKIRSEIKETKYQMEKISSKATSMTVLGDIERREKKEVMGKLHEMEKELKLLAKSESMTDQSLNQLKGDNNRLREENLSLIRVISKLSGGEQNVNQVMNMMGRLGGSGPTSR